MKPTYLMTFEELTALAEQGETIVTNLGYLICSKDRKFKKHIAHQLWADDVAAAREKGLIEPMRPTNVKKRPFSWSVSSLQSFENCPRRYAEEKFYCTIPWIETEPQKWGNRVHDAAEAFVKTGTIKDPEAFKEVEVYARFFRKLKDQGYTVEPETQIVLDQNMKPLTGKNAWFSKEAWFRAKIDVPVVKESACMIYDYKTGKKVKDDQDQLKIYCAALSLINPELEEFTSKLIWTRHSTVTGTSPQVLNREHLKEVWADVLGRVKRMEDAWRSEVWPERPSGLCRNWCPVSSCPHCGKGR